MNGSDTAQLYEYGDVHVMVKILLKPQMHTDSN